MDPVANINEQRQLSSEIIELIDGHTHDDGTLEGGAAQLVADRANRLAELVQALDGWRQGGGFDPYSASPPELPPGLYHGPTEARFST